MQTFDSQPRLEGSVSEVVAPGARSRPLPRPPPPWQCAAAAGVFHSLRLGQRLDVERPRPFTV